MDAKDKDDYGNGNGNGDGDDDGDGDCDDDEDDDDYGDRGYQIFSGSNNSNNETQSIFEVKEFVFWAHVPIHVIWFSLPSLLKW